LCKPRQLRPLLCYGLL
nr:immunoglobulin heavy chain junction region [Mus musculus]